MAARKFAPKRSKEDRHAQLLEAELVDELHLQVDKLGNNDGRRQPRIRLEPSKRGDVDAAVHARNRGSLRLRGEAAERTRCAQ